MPPEFPFLARSMIMTEAATYWNVSVDVVRRWVKEAGDGLAEAMYENLRHACRINGAKRGKVNNTPKPPEDALPLDKDAMRFLQRKKGWICHSSRIYGATKDVRYFIGSRNLNLEELLALARSYGFSG